LELPHRHEEDNVHYFPRGLIPSIHEEVALKIPKTLHEAIQAALRAEAAETEIETTQRSTGRLNVIKEDSDFSEAAEEVEGESDEDSHGSTDEKPRELYENRRLKRRSTDSRRRATASFFTIGDTSLSSAQTRRTRRTTECENPGRERET
jgi:hypothetical protein